MKQCPSEKFQIFKDEFSKQMIIRGDYGKNINAGVR